MQSVTCLFSRKQSQTPRLLSKVSGRGKPSSEQFALATASRPVKCLQCENRNLLSWMDALVIAAEKSCNKKSQSGFRLGTFYLSDELCLAELISAEDCLQCLFCEAKSMSEPICRCCRIIHEYTANQWKGTVAYYKRSCSGLITRGPYDCSLHDMNQWLCAPPAQLYIFSQYSLTNMN